MTQIFAIILAGGSGTRLWPLSRGLLPKHLLALDGKESLLQLTARRLLGSVSPERIVTVTHESHRFEVKGQLHVVDPALAEWILAEPQANNTLPAIAWAVAEVVKKEPDAVVGIFPADHLIEDENSFQKDLYRAFEVAHQGYLVTLGIKPSCPETGYGYIEGGLSLSHSGAFTVRAFVEKPDQETAASYLQKGNYYWNSGMFAFKASLFLEELKKFEPGIFDAVQRIVGQGRCSNIVGEYGKMKKISIDYGVMEKSGMIAVVPASFGWSDLGNWETVYERGKKDAEQNVKEGDVLSLDTSSSLLISKKGHLATIGLENMIVVQTGDAVLVSHRDRAQDVKMIVERLKKRGSQLAETHPTASRPWGSYTILEEGPGYKIKRIVVNPEQRLSFQRHQHRAEHWVVIEGTARITNGTFEETLQANESTFIAQGEKHRLENLGDTPLVIIEVQTGSYLGEDDIERFDDIYGRL